MAHLILVACHAVYIADNFNHPLGDSSWSLQSFQTGEPPFYVEHIQRGVELAQSDPNSLLIFAGGQTRLEAGPRSEGQSYWLLANHFGWWSDSEVKSRATTEEFSCDSFENVLFGLCRFREFMGTYPEKMTVVSWAFKERRFNLHRQAVRFPAQQFVFIGANQPPELEKALSGEAKNGIGPFLKDPYGTSGVLAAKRKERNPFNRQHGYFSSCPEIAGLLSHCGPELYQGEVPW